VTARGVAESRQMYYNGDTELMTENSNSLPSDPDNVPPADLPPVRVAETEGARAEAATPSASGFAADFEAGGVEPPIDYAEAMTAEPFAGAYPSAAEAPSEASVPHASRGGGVWSALREVAETIILTLVIFVLVRAVVENYRVEGSSMEPNLFGGEYLIVNKALYTLRPAERGDIIVFKAPQSPDKNFVKRIIGLPGEKVELKAGQVYVNDKLLYEPYIDARFGYSWGPSVVGPDQLFVLGDNRNNSSDSHSWGMLPEVNVIGKAWICYWPPQSWGFLPHYALALK
jgi:signal peptidase I